MVMTGIVCTCVTSVTLSSEMLFVFVGAHSGGMCARVEVMAATVCIRKIFMFIEGGVECLGGLEIEQRTPDQCCINIESISLYRDNRNGMYMKSQTVYSPLE